MVSADKALFGLTAHISSTSPGLCIIGYTVETAVMHVTRVCIMTVNRLTVGCSTQR